MAFNLDNLADVLRSRGLKVVEVDGWKYRGYAQQDMQPVRGVLWHHTATNRAAFVNNAPTLNLCVNGRSDLPGPLANIVFGRDGTCYIVATGVANHAGTGSAHGIPVNMGNHYLIGIEMESSGIKPWDWTDEQLSEAPKLGAALELAYLQARPADERLQLGHLEYSDAGKIDPAGWPGGMDGLRAAINNQIDAWSKTGAQPLAETITIIKEDALSADAEQNILAALASTEAGLRQNIKDHFLGGTTSADGWRPGATKLLIENQRRINTANVNIAALTELVGQLALGQGVTIDYAKIEASVKAALADGIEITGEISVGGK